MSCARCASDNQVEFPAEMNIHFSGLKNLDKPGVWVFPRVLVCLHCGFSQFIVAGPELALLVKDTPAYGTSNGKESVDRVQPRRGITLQGQE